MIIVFFVGHCLFFFTGYQDLKSFENA